MSGFTYEEQGENKYLVYEVERKEQLDRFMLGMLQNNDIPGVIKAVSMQIDETVFLRYDVTGRQELSEYFGGNVQKKRLLKALRSILDGMRSSEEYMINPQMFVLDAKRIYVDAKLGTAGLICLPLDSYSDQTGFPAFIKQFITDLRFDPNEDAGYVAKLISYLNDDVSFTFDGFASLLKELETGVSKEPERTVKHNAADPERSQTGNAKPIERKQDEIKKEKPVERKQVEIKKEKPAPERKNEMSLMHLLMHFSKDNLEIYKSQRKDDRIPDTDFSIPGQEKKKTPEKEERIAVEKKKQQNREKQESQEADKLDFGNTITEFGGAYEEGATVILPENQSAETTRILNIEIKRLKTGESILIDKDIFRIGREPLKVDYCISDNLAIGREHATLVVREDELFVIDNASTNHTYLNGRQLKPHDEYEVKRGDIISFADEKYQFV